MIYLGMCTDANRRRTSMQVKKEHLQLNNNKKNKNQIKKYESKHILILAITD